MSERRLFVNINDFENIIGPDVWLDCAYIGSCFFFILSIRGFSRQEAAKMGNLYGILGMILAIFATAGSSFVYGRALWIFFVVCIPTSLFACLIAMKIKMTSMPQLIGFLNACGGLAATLEAFALYFSPYEVAKQKTMQNIGSVRYIQFQVYQTIFYLISACVGIITFCGSLVACAKLSGKIASKPRLLRFRAVWTPILLGVIIATGVVAGILGLGNVPIGTICLSLCCLTSAVYGVSFVMAIGGADMPVVISILNSGSGWAGVFTGLTLHNSLIVISGAFVGASGIILSHLMCKAMNRSLWHVLVGGFGDTEIDKTQGFHGEPTIWSSEEVLDELSKASTIIIVPGYGMAVSKAQFSVHELVDILHQRGVKVLFALHPVAGRLPGHMNVLLAEANVPYDIVYSMEDVNPDFCKTDVVLVIGANDIVNPASQTSPGCPIYGMPVLEVWKAKTVIVIKRSFRVGYAGVDNPLFFYENTRMYLGDAKSAILKLNEGLRIMQKQKCSNISLAETDCQKSLETTMDHTIDVCDLKTETKETEKTLFLGVLKESMNDHRVALIPNIVSKLTKKSTVGVVVESLAGEHAGFVDQDYVEAGATIEMNVKEIMKKCKILLKVTTFSLEEVFHLSQYPGKILIAGFVGPNQMESQAVQQLISSCLKNKATLISLDVLPRTTNAQKMDILSSTAKVAGYRAVVEALSHCGRLIGGEITAAGKYPPVKALVIGAGVAGLQAIGDLHRLGADVFAFDARLECKEQVESVGGKFLELHFDGEDGGTEAGYAKPMSEEFVKKEMQLFAKQCERCDIIITTAAIPGRRAPQLIKEEHVRLMKKGSVIVDLAASSGGNVEITRPGETYVYDNNVTIVGVTDLPSRVAQQASAMVSHNFLNLLKHMGIGDDFKVNMEDEIIRAVTITHEGKKTYPPPHAQQPQQTERRSLQIEKDIQNYSKMSRFRRWVHHRYFNIFSPLDICIISVVVAFTALFATTAPPSFPPLLFIFVLSCFVGYLLIWGVTPALYTPLMSVSNAISGVVLVGGMFGISATANKTLAEEYCMNLQLGPSSPFFCYSRGVASITLNLIAIAVASINVFGGFAVTQRMLLMFKKSKY